MYEHLSGARDLSVRAPGFKINPDLPSSPEPTDIRPHWESACNVEGNLQVKAYLLRSVKMEAKAGKVFQLEDFDLLQVKGSGLPGPFAKHAPVFR